MSKSKPLKMLPEERDSADDGDGDDDDTQEPPPLTADEAAMRAFLPAAFGKQTVKPNVEAQFAQTRRRPLDAPDSPPRKSKGKGKGKQVFVAQRRVDDSDDEAEVGRRNAGSRGGGSMAMAMAMDNDDDDEDNDDDDDSDDDDDEDEYPISHEITLKDHTKPVSSISLDPSGTRIATGSHDYLVKLWDFPSMSSDHLHAFKSFEPSESHHVHAAVFSHVDSGQSLLVVPAAPQARVLSRDGDTLVEFAKGDMYLRDMHNTKGHVSELTAGAWHPTDRAVVATAGTDSTVRIWDVARKRQHRDIMVHKSRTGKGGRSRVCCLAWAGGSTGGQNLIATVALDGVLALYAGDGPYSRPAMEVRDAHQRETWTGGIAFSHDGRMLVTRGQDGDIKLWDTRKIKTPVTTRTAFATPLHPEATIAFSPNSTTLITGDTDGTLHILSAATLRTEHALPVTPGSPLIAVAWHPRINHILTGSANGHVHALYNPALSTRGALLVVAKAPRKRHIDDATETAAVSSDAVILPNAILGIGGGGRRGGGGGGGAGGVGGGEKDPRRPSRPAVTPWGKSQPDQGHIESSIPLASMRDEDPRAALLKYAEMAEREPMFTAAWRETQPVTVYAEVDEEEEEAERAAAAERGKRRRRG
ncbi:WD40-repeat-containing domain protein [Morchella snyderi]|nr:WD40-repeat-containing domain protein [Morchella snyderi]